MLTYIIGDILRVESEAIINTVNCVGVMGRGIALQFKNAYPENFKAYAKACKAKEVQPGKMFVTETGQLSNPRFIINFPTKRHWRAASRMEDIDSGLSDLVRVVRELKIKSLSIPPLDSGLGGLDWSNVRPRIEATFASLDDVQVTIFEPAGAPASEKMVHNQEVPKMTPGRAALVELMNRYLSGLLAPAVTLLELHKLMYFMQEAGEPLKLKYSKAPYGPYAENLTHVLKKIEGHLISGYADGGDAPNKQLNLVPGAVEESAKFLEDKADTRSRFERVSKLVDGFESPYGLELLSTVHWIAKEEPDQDLGKVVEQTHRWNERKKMFTPRQIEIATETLRNQGWISLASESRYPPFTRQ